MDSRGYSIGQQRIPMRQIWINNGFMAISHLSNIIPRCDRKAQVYCVGLPRSGTHTLAEILGCGLKSSHEPLKKLTISFIVNEHVRRNDEQVMQWLRLRDACLRLEVEASHFMHYFANHLARLFPLSRFILTIREPLSWLESEINVNHSAGRSVYWRNLEEYRYGISSVFNEDFDRDWQLRDDRIEKCLSYWVRHIETVIDGVPPERLMIVNTSDISSEMANICRFVGLDDSCINCNARGGLRARSVVRICGATRVRVIDHIKKLCLPMIHARLPFLLRDMGYIAGSTSGY